MLSCKEDEKVKVAESTENVQDNWVLGISEEV